MCRFLTGGSIRFVNFLKVDKSFGDQPLGIYPILLLPLNLGEGIAQAPVPRHIKIICTSAYPHICTFAYLCRHEYPHPWFGRTGKRFCLETGPKPQMQ